MQHLDEATHRLKVTGRITSPLELSVADLRARFAARMITSGLQRAGNRRAEMKEVARTEGDPWACGAVGNVRWTGGDRCATCSPPRAPP